ncbi:MAG: oligosaccharide flippase family protein [Gammaproteobacteria bacterium]
MKSHHLARFCAWRPGAYLRASASLFPWLLLRTLGQAVLVIGLARLLGATGYGRFIVVLAVATFFTPLAGLGLQGVLLREGSRNPEALFRQLGAALRLWLPATVFFGLIGIATSLLVLPHPPPTLAVVALVLGEVASGSLVELLARVAQSQNRIQRYGAMMAGLILVRVAALALYALLTKPDVAGWMWVYAAASLIYTAWLLARVYPKLVFLRSSAGSLKTLLRQSAPFALGTLSVRLQNEFNKPVLAELSYGLAGNFSAAQRAVDIASLPLTAMQEALWPRLYASADSGRRMRFMAAFLMALALLGGGVLYGAAPWVPYFLGSGFDTAAHLLQFLAALPVLQVLRNFGNFQAAAVHQTHVIAWAYFVGGVSSVMLTLWLIPVYGWDGAVAALYLTEIVVIAVQTAFRLRHLKRAS